MLLLQSSVIGALPVMAHPRRSVTCIELRATRTGPGGLEPKLRGLAWNTALA